MANWYNSAWKFRQKITIESSGVGSGGETNIPIFLNLANLGAAFFNEVKSDGGDIRITTSDGVTLTPREVVSINIAGQSGELWFKAPAVSSAADTDFYIYYGHESATEPAADSTYGSENVWDSNFLGVWHGEVSGGLLHDSTANDNDLSGSGSNTAGKVGQAKAALGDFAKGSAISAATNNLTIECWAKPTSTNGIANAIMDGDGPSSGFSIAQSNGSGANGDHVSNLFGGVGWVDTSGRWNAGTWLHVVATYSGGSVANYANASSVGGGAKSMNTPSNFKVGDDGGGRVSIGDVDEMRFSNVVRSAAWITTEYNNMNDPASFYTIAAQESFPAGSPVAIM